MNRRNALVVLFVFGSVAAPWRSFAQQQPMLWRLGYLSPGSGPSDATHSFVRRLRELGYIENRNIVIEWRWAAGDVTRLPRMASDLVRLNVDLILVGTNYAAEVARGATRTIPIVIPGAADPVGSGLAESLARPGGNVTGLSVMVPELAGKKLQLLREIVPQLRRVAVLALAHATEPGFATGARLLLDQLRQPARQLGIAILPQAAGVAADVPTAFAAMHREKAQALIVQANSLTFDHRKRIAELAARQNLPTIYDLKFATEAGGLISYGPDIVEMYRRAAEIVDKVFKGAKPADMPFEQPTKYELVINLKSAKALGLNIPRSLLLRADQVIE
ncbi:MAG: ABC transporter substrate-binding protein [Betaproteobacteria bacterium]|nr:MAG: ABC transporter substrate-binding protein [Betaproteobacteria bacterium]